MKNLGELYSVVLPMFSAIVASQYIPLHQSLHQKRLKKRRETERLSCTKQMTIDNWQFIDPMSPSQVLGITIPIYIQIQSFTIDTRTMYIYTVKLTIVVYIGIYKI